MEKLLSYRLGLSLSLSLLLLFLPFSFLSTMCNSEYVTAKRSIEFALNVSNVSTRTHVRRLSRFFHVICIIANRKDTFTYERSLFLPPLPFPFLSFPLLHGRPSQIPTPLTQIRRSIEMHMFLHPSTARRVALFL